jgi:predicted deacylase
MVPACNVPAFETITRSNPIDDLNLARTFPGSGDGSITERIAHVIATQQALPRRCRRRPSSEDHFHGLSQAVDGPQYLHTHYQGRPLLQCALHLAL